MCVVARVKVLRTIASLVTASAIRLSDHWVCHVPLTLCHLGGWLESDRQDRHNADSKETPPA
jgi:hypothetical protein